MAVITDVKNERTGAISLANAMDLNMDGTVEIFKTLDGTDLKSQLALGQAIYDVGLLCFVPPPTAYH